MKVDLGKVQFASKLPIGRRAPKSEAGAAFARDPAVPFHTTLGHQLEGKSHLSCVNSDTNALTSYGN